MTTRILHVFRDCRLRVFGSVLLLVLFTSRLSQVKIKGPRQTLRHKTSIFKLTWYVVCMAKTSYLKVCVACVEASCYMSEHMVLFGMEPSVLNKFGRR